MTENASAGEFLMPRLTPPPIERARSAPGRSASEPLMDPLTQYLRECEEAPGYLDFARVGPPLRSVITARAKSLETLARGMVGAVSTLEEVQQRARSRAATLVGVATHECTIASSTSAALMSVAFALSSGGNVIVPSGEFPANVVPWLRAAARGGPTVIRAPRAADGSYGAEQVARVLTPDTVAVTVSAVGYATGWKAPLATIREVIGPDRILVVDAIQGLGVCDLQLETADVVIAGAQKWLRAGQGAAIFAVRDHVADRLHPTLGGWPSMPELDSDCTAAGASPVRGPARFLPTNVDLEAAAGLDAALSALATCGPARVHQRQRLVAHSVRQVLSRFDATVIGAEWTPEQRGPILSFTLPGLESDRVKRELADHGVSVSVRDEHVRISAHLSFGDESAAVLEEALWQIKPGTGRESRPVTS
ncbi:MAG: aminotransferase class V-fold PLP-dependent enzyme [Terracoccus sp.]